MLTELKKLGLTDGEARVYIALLKTGSSTVGPVVKQSDVAYSKVYEIIERLIKKGLVTYIIKEKTKHFQATNPENLKAYLEKKQEEIDGQKTALDSILPSITKISKETSEEAEIFIGNKGLRTAYEILLEDTKKNDDFLFFITLPKEKVEEVAEFYSRIGKKFKEVGVNLKGISHETYRDVPGTKETALWTKMRYVNFPIPSTLDICKDKILLISWEKPAGFLIRSQELADNLRGYFNSVWEKAKQ
jgi:sugar-specific transcriptional regulator TrmB